MVSQAGDNVVIGRKMIPAINIQVWDVPGFVKHPDGSVAWYGIYFEVMFEDGALWTVSYGADGTIMEEEGWDGAMFGRITVSEYNEWGVGQQIEEPSFERQLDNWDKFIEMYDSKLNRDGD